MTISCVGGLGNDVLTGAGGQDIFVFDTKLNKKSNYDKIVDFVVKRQFDLARQRDLQKARQEGQRGGSGKAQQQVLHRGREGQGRG